MPPPDPSTTSHASDRSERRDTLSLADFLVVAVQLGALLMVVRFFAIEAERGLVHLTPLLFAGFAIHAWLPLRTRLPFFVLLTVVSIGVLMGPEQGAILVGLSLGIIGICHLPLPLKARVAVILVLGAALAAVHRGWQATDWSVAVIPVLGSIFMFRLVLYLYDMATDRLPASLWQRLGYFFLLPNVFAPLFPVVDYATYLRTYYQRDAREIYQTGLAWILRGLTHLVLYRFVYQALPSIEGGTSGLFGFLSMAAFTYALYLRVSGLFHLMVGLLCLFGFDLPETNHRYFLASSVNEMWRRINIYFKDFLMKLVFYPVVYRTRRLGLSTGMALASVIVLMASWILHSYQWFWLRGDFPITTIDAFFWSTLALCVAANTVWEVRRGRRRPRKKVWSLRRAVGLSLQTVAYFLFISNLWYLWDLGTFSEWLVRVRGIAMGPRDLALVAAVLGSLVAAGTVSQWISVRGWTLLRLARPSFWPLALRTATVAVALVLIGLPPVQDALGARVSRIARIARSNALNQEDLARQERGYYETLTRATSFTSPLAFQGRDPRWQKFQESPAVMFVDDQRLTMYRPDIRIEFKHVPLSTNRWGMRDRFYPKEKPAGTFRIALTGGSIEAGSGVADDEVFESLVEERLNREHAGRAWERYEILNFATPNWSLTQILFDLEHRVFEFAPDVVMYVGHSFERYRVARQLARVIHAGVEIEDPFLRDMITRVGARPGMIEAEAAELVVPHQDDILSGAYARLAEVVRAHGAVPVWLYLPRLEKRESRQEMEALATIAREAGFVVITLDDVYRGLDPREIQLADWDDHPDRVGHARIAERLYERLVERSAEIGLGIDPAPAQEAATAFR